jgi:hypothetical protein
MPIVQQAPAPPDSASAPLVDIGPALSAVVIQGCGALIYNTGLGYENDDSLKDRLQAETSEPDIEGIKEFGHDLLRYTAPISLLRSAKIRAGAATLGLLDEIEADILGEVEDNTFNEGDWENHARRLAAIRDVKALVQGATVTLGPAEQEAMRVGIFASLRRIDVDRPSEARYAGYPERLAAATARQALHVACDENAGSIVWSFGRGALVGRMTGCLAHLEESVGHTPSEGVTQHAEAIIAARAYVAELTPGGSAVVSPDGGS